MILNDYLIFVIGIFATFFTLWSTVPQIRKSLQLGKKMMSKKGSLFH